MAPTKSAGRVSIRVLPDTTGFRKDLRDYLKKIEDSMRVKIKATPELDRTALQKMKQQIEALKIKITPAVDLKIDDEELDALRAKIERMRPEINVRTNTARAATQIANLTRTRLVSIVPRLNRAAMTNVAARLGALGGLNVMGDLFKEGGEFLRNADRNAVKLGTMMTQIMGVVGAVGALTSNLLVMGGQLLDIVAITSVLPAFGIGMAISIGALIAVLKDAGEVLGEYGPSFGQLQDEMSENYWSHLILPIRSLYETHFPTLNRELVDLSNALGDFSGEFVEAFQRNVTTEKMSTMFNRLEGAVRILKGAIDPLMSAFTELGLHGSSYFDDFSRWIVDLSEDFDDFITKASNDGRLKKWTDDGILAMQELGRSIGGIYRIFSALTRAAESAGGANLTDFADAMHGIADTLSRPDAQRAMESYFRGFHEMMQGITDGLMGLGPALMDFATPMETAMGDVGDILETVLGYLGDFLSHPAVQEGFVNFFKGVEEGVKGLEPAIDDFALGLGGTFDLLGKIAEELGKSIGVLFDEWGPSLDDLGSALEELVGPMGDLIRTVIEELTPAIEPLVDDVLVPLINYIRDYGIPAIEDLVEAFGPDAVKLIEDFGKVLQENIIPALEDLSEWIQNGGADKINTIFDDLLPGDEETPDVREWIRKHIDEPVNNWLEGAWGNLGDEIARTWRNMWNFTDREGMNPSGIADLEAWIRQNIDEPVNNWLEGAWSNLGDEISRSWNNMWTFDQDRGGLHGVEEWIETNINTPVNDWLEGAWRNLGETISTAWNDFWRGLWEDLAISRDESRPTLIEGFNGWIEDLYNGIKEGFQTIFVDPWTQMWKDLFDKPVEESELSKAEFGLSMGGWGEDLDLWLRGMAEKWHIFWGETFPAAWNEFIIGFGEGWNEFWGVTLPEAWNTFVTWLTETWNEFWGVTLPTAWTTFMTTVSEGWNTFWGTTVPEAWNGFVAWLTESWNTFWTGLGTTLSAKWGEFQTTISTKVVEIQTNISNFGNTVRETWNVLWEAVKTKVNEAWSNIVSWISEKTGISEQDIRNFASNAVSSIRDFATNIVSSARDAMSQFAERIRSGVDTAIQWLRELPGKAVAALSNLGGELVGSGQALIQGFIDGMGSMVDTARGAASSILETIRGFFPSSPAKEGPFSGKGWTLYSGRALVDGFAEGINSRMGVARSATEKLMKAVDTSVFANGAPDLGVDGITVDRRSIQVINHNPIAEPTSRTIEKASSHLRMAGAI